MEELRLPFTPEVQEAWAWVIPVASALASVVSNLWSNKKNEKINERQLENQHDILQKEQEYNTMMMQNQKQMQMQDAKQAGANPAFAQGSLLGGMSSSPSAPSVSQFPMTSPVGNQLMDVMNYMLQKKQIDASSQNLYADTYKKLAERDRQLIENEWLPQLLKGEVDINTSTLAVNGSIKFKNEQEAKNFAQQVLESSKRVEKMDEEVKEIQATVSNIDVDTRIKKIQEYFESDRCKYVIDELKASANLSKEQARDLVLTRCARICLLDSQAQESLQKSLNISVERDNLREVHRLLGFEGDSLEFNLRSDKRYKNKERALGLVNGVTKSFSDITSGISDILGSINPLKGILGNGKGHYTSNNSYNPSNFYRGEKGNRVYYGQ